MLDRAFGLKTNPVVFTTSTALVAAFVIFGSLFTEAADALFTSTQRFITSNLGWLFHGSATFFLYFCAAICLTRWGKIRLGQDDERPEYGYFTWFSMLFSAGMGIGVLFWSVAEPLTHLMHPPLGTAGSAAAAQQAMNITLLHWGLHGWGIYVVVGLALAYFTYRRGQPLTLRSAFLPLLGRHIHGPLGHALDIFAVLGTMFGVATTLGMGAQQINAGLQHLLGVVPQTSTQLMIIGVVTLFAMASVVSGLDRGIRLLSQWTIWLGLALFAYVLLAGPTVSTLGTVAQSLANYGVFVGRQALWANPGGDLAWQSDWTLFYWGWWISWSPFVGMFVARISRGRTIREFVLGVLLVPSAVTSIWFSVFGGMAMNRVAAGDSELARVVEQNFPIAIFAFFDGLPLATMLTVVGSLLIVMFFVTSSDSASLVIDYLTSGGNMSPPIRQRVFWATTEGVVAAVLLIAGGLKPMRIFQIITGLPLCISLLLMCVSIVRGLSQEPMQPPPAGNPSPR